MPQKVLSAETILKRIDEGCHALYDELPREHLGMSLLGKSCARRIWLSWRWAKVEPFSARMLRLFNRGHREEERFIEWLEQATMIVDSIDPNTGEQWEVVSCKGYIKGHLDAEVYMDRIVAVTEMKTHNDKYFAALRKAQSVKVAHFEHYCQLQRYMKARKRKYGLYLAVNKNTDALYVEVVTRDKSTQDWLVEREKGIFESKSVPTGIADSEGYWECNFCPFLGICFNNEEINSTCRMCQHVRLPGKAKWACGRTKKKLELNFKDQLRGCKKIKPITL